MAHNVAEAAPKGDGAPAFTNSLELRLERFKRLGNLELDYLNRLNDRRPIGELYVSGEIDLHIHFSMDGMWCATYRCADSIEIPITDSRIPKSSVVPLDADKFSVFVSIGEVSKGFRPIASAVWLQPLDCCHMGCIDPLEPHFRPPRKVLFPVYDRKLRAVLSNAGVMFGEFKDEIIEGAPKIVTNFTDQDSYSHGYKRICGTHEFEIVRRIRIELGDNFIFLLPQCMDYPLPQISNVFVCPPHAFKAAIELMSCHDMISR